MFPEARIHANPPEPRIVQLLFQNAIPLSGSSRRVVDSCRCSEPMKSWLRTRSTRNITVLQMGNCRRMFCRLARIKSPRDDFLTVSRFGSKGERQLNLIVKGNGKQRILRLRAMFGCTSEFSYMTLGIGTSESATVGPSPPCNLRPPWCRMD
jgi:hypothetical protein